jgi:hypothetical protein
MVKDSMGTMLITLSTSVKKLELCRKIFLKTEKNPCVFNKRIDFNQILSYFDK